MTPGGIDFRVLEAAAFTASNRTLDGPGVCTVTLIGAGIEFSLFLHGRMGYHDVTWEQLRVIKPEDAAAVFAGFLGLIDEKLRS